MSSRQRSTRCLKRARKRSAGKEHARLVILMPPKDVCREFARLNLLARFHSGEFTVRVLERRPKRNPTDDRHTSQTSDWLDHTGKVVATVHEWFDDAGNSTASRLPDPKWVGGDVFCIGVADASKKLIPDHDYTPVDPAMFDAISRRWPHKKTSTPFFADKCNNCGRYWMELRAKNGSGRHMEAANLSQLLQHDH